jgi:TolB-like protein
MIGDIEQDYISDGITEDIITALSQIREFFVIARSTMFTYKGRPIDVQALSTQLGVRYVLEGSVRTAGQRLRISVQLNDGTIGSQIWAERFDRDLEDIFAVQDEIAQIVVGVLGRELSHAEQRRAVTKPPGNLDAWGLFHRGMFHFYRRTREDNIEARRLFELAIDRDPSFATPYAMISRTRSVDAILFGRDRDSGLAFTTARRAIELDDRAASSHFALGLAHLFIERDGAAAFLAFTEAITINPNDAQGNTGIAMALIGLGRAEEAIAYLERAIRLSPWDSNIGTFFGRLAIGNLFLERHEAAVEWGRKAEPRTKVWIERIALPAALALLGRAVEAQKACEELKALRPKLSLEIVRSNEPTAHQRYLDILLDGLRKAGLEER